jgi:mannose-6-phosphate isomerase-like protein (cupin superfamily)
MVKIIDIDKAQVSDLPHGRGKKIALFDPSSGVHNVDVHINLLNPGVTRGSVHYHMKIENIYIILEGTGEILDDVGNKYPIKAGQAVFMRPGKPPDSHELYNIGNTPLKLVEIYAPPHPEETYFKQKSSPVDKRDHIILKRTE